MAKSLRNFMMQIKDSYKLINCVNTVSFGTKYSRMDQEKFVEESL